MVNKNACGNYLLIISSKLILFFIKKINIIKFYYKIYGSKFCL